MVHHHITKTISTINIIIPAMLGHGHGHGHIHGSGDGDDAYDGTYDCSFDYAVMHSIIPLLFLLLLFHEVAVVVVILILHHCSLTMIMTMTLP